VDKVEKVPDQFGMTRVAWTLKYAGVNNVAILNGGQNQWVAGDLALESSLAKYEEGVARLKKCYSILENIEKKIALITKKDDGTIQEIPFNIDAKIPRSLS